MSNHDLKNLVRAYFEEVVSTGDISRVEAFISQRADRRTWRGGQPPEPLLRIKAVRMVGPPEGQ